MLEIKSFTPDRFTNLIERIWVINAANTEFDLFIPPTPFPNIIFSLNKHSVWYNNKAHSTPVAQDIIYSPTQFKIEKNSAIVGIRFYSYGWYPFSGMDKTTPIDSFNFILSKEDGLNKLEGFYNNRNLERICQTILGYLEQIYSLKKEEEIRIIEKLTNEIKLNNHGFSITQFCEEEDINYITFYRLFKKIIGVSPKKYERLIKFCKSLDKILRDQADLTDVGFSVGYFDQPHFVKEFKYFMQMTPTEYINRYNNDSYLKDIRSLLQFSIY